MKELTIIRDNNYLIQFRPLKIFVDGKFLDYIEPKEKSKVILIDDSSNNIKIGVNNCSSNIVTFDSNLEQKNSFKLEVTSQVQNGLFIFIFICFFGGLILKLLNILTNVYLLLATLLPFGIIVYWQTFGKNNYLRLTKK